MYSMNEADNLNNINNKNDKNMGRHMRFPFPSMLLNIALITITSCTRRLPGTNLFHMVTDM